MLPFYKIGSLINYVVLWLKSLSYATSVVGVQNFEPLHLPHKTSKSRKY